MDFTADMPCHVETIFFTRRQIACVSALLPRQLDMLAIEGERTGRTDEEGGRKETLSQTKHGSVHFPGA